MNLENQFEIIVKGDFPEVSKHIYRKRIFHKGDFTHVMSFLTVIQDIYNKWSLTAQTSLDGASITGSVFQPRPSYWLLFSPYGLSLSSLYIKQRFHFLI